MGLSIGPQSVSKKRGKLVLQNLEKLNDNFKKQIRQNVLNHSISISKRAERSVMEYEPPSADKTESGTTDVHFFDMVNSFKTPQANKSFTCPSDHSCLTVSSNDYVTRKEFCTDVPKSEPVHVLYNPTTELKSLTLNTNLGRVEFPSLPSRHLNHFQLNESVDVVANSERSRVILKDFITRNADQISPTIPRFEIIGDNLDHTISPTNMTKDKQRKSLHWFLNVAVQRRVLADDLPCDKPKAEIMKVANSNFLPSREECESFHINMIHHIAQVITKYIDCLQPY